MKKDFKYYIGLFVLVSLCGILIPSCSDSGTDTPEPQPQPEANKIEINSPAPVMEQKEGTATVSFSTNATWTASIGGTTPWASVSPASGKAGTHTLTLTVTENESYDERNATLTIKAGNASRNITVTQKQMDALTVTSNKIEIGAEGGNFSIVAKANVSVTYEIEESAKKWISANESRGLTTTTLSFTAKSNDNTERRQGNIILKGGEGLTEMVTVYQEGEKPTLVITDDNIIVGSDGDIICIELKSNCEYSYELPEVDWINESESRAFSTYTHYLEVLPNETYDNRTAKVKFVNNETGDEEYVTIQQMQLNAIVIAGQEYQFGYEEQNWELEVNTNIEFEAVTSADWVKVMEIASRGLEPKKVFIHLEANESTDVREATLTLTGENVSQVIKVAQDAMPFFALSQTEFTIPSAGDTIQVEVSNTDDYEYQMPDVEWIKEINSRALTKHIHTFVVLPNDSYDPRNASVKFISKTDNEEMLVEIKQMKANAIVVAQENYRISSEANYWELTVNTNVEFEVVSSADWLKIDETNSRGLVEKKLYLSAEANVSVDSREATVTLNGEEGLVQTIHIVQMGKTNRIKLVVKHEETTMMAPYVYSQNIFGTTDWGDGTIENFTHQGTHTYKSTGPKTTTFDIYGADALAITELNSISSLVIYVDKDKNSSVEDVEIDQKEWD